MNQSMSNQEIVVLRKWITWLFTTRLLLLGIKLVCIHVCVNTCGWSAKRDLQQLWTPIVNYPNHVQKCQLLPTLQPKSLGFMVADPLKRNNKLENNFMQVTYTQNNDSHLANTMNSTMTSTTLICKQVNGVGLLFDMLGDNDLHDMDIRRFWCK